MIFDFIKRSPTGGTDGDITVRVGAGKKWVFSVKKQLKRFFNFEFTYEYHQAFEQFVQLIVQLL